MLPLSSFFWVKTGNVIMVHRGRGGLFPMKKLTVFICVYNEPEMVIRALDSIPKRDDIEILVVDDSTDETTENILKWADENRPLRLIHNTERKGLGHAKNIAYTCATGEYIHELDADDYLYTEEYEKAMAYLNGTDIVYMDLQIDDGTVWRISRRNKHHWCAGIWRFIRREFIGDTRCDEVFCNEDVMFEQRLSAKPHTEKYTHIVGYHYTFPRENSLSDKRNKGLL